MSDDIDRRVREELAAIEQEKKVADENVRTFLAVVGGIAGWWLHSKFGHNEDILWFIGVGAFLGAAHEILSGLIVIVFIVALVKCS